MKQEVVDYLTGIPCWFLATAEETRPQARPHVRPFSFAAMDDGRIVFCTANTKDVYRELKADPWFELSGWHHGHGWIVVAGRAVLDVEVSASTRKAGYDHLTGLGEVYNGASDERLTFFSIEDATAKIADIDGRERTIDLDG